MTNSEQNMNFVEKCSDLVTHITKLAEDENRESAFFVADLSDITEKILTWRTELPDIKPYYAVKCNPEHAVLSLMVSKGLGFDCASKNEIDAVLAAGAKPSDIIYAHPYKSIPFLKHAQKKGVDLMTFDSESELYKIKKIYGTARLLLRFRLANVKAGFPLNKKFGCAVEECHDLLQTAKELNMNVIGTCFHVGSLCEEPEAYRRAIHIAKYIFDVGNALGFQFTYLDLGGGYPGHRGSESLYLEMFSTIRKALDEYFPNRKNLNIVAEPGCFLLCSAFNLCTTIIGKKKVPFSNDVESDDGSSDLQMMYYLNDSVYLSFPEGVEMYHLRTIPLMKDNDKNSARSYMVSRLWGCTCCSSDCILKKCILPEMELGEHIIFLNMGAYTLNFATDFNCFPKPSVFYTFTGNDTFDFPEFTKSKDASVQTTNKNRHHLKVTLTERLQYPPSCYNSWY